jgi:hypothetical protein
MHHARKTKKDRKWFKISVLLLEDSDNETRVQTMCTEKIVSAEMRRGVCFVFTGIPVLTASGCHIFQPDDFNFSRKFIRLLQVGH